MPKDILGWHMAFDYIAVDDSSVTGAQPAGRPSFRLWRGDRPAVVDVLHPLLQSGQLIIGRGDASQSYALCELHEMSLCTDV